MGIITSATITTIMVTAFLSFAALTSSGNKRQIKQMDNEESFYTSEVGAVHAYVTNQCDVQAPQYLSSLQASTDIIQDMNRFSNKKLKTSLIYDGNLNRHCGESVVGNGKMKKRICIVESAPPAVGALDASFDGDGFAAIGATGDKTEALQVLTQPDNKIIVVAKGQDASGHFGFLIRYREDGTLDTSFGNSGKAMFSYSGLTNFAFSYAVVQPDGKIVVRGNRTGVISFGGMPHITFLVRYQSNGVVDAAFGADGLVDILDGIGTGLHPRPDGKLVVAWLGGDQGFRFWLLNPNGTLDSSFGTAGTKQITFHGYYEVMSSVAVQTDNSIVAVGSVATAPATNGVYPSHENIVLRILPNGNPDSSFGIGGKAVIETSNVPDKLVASDVHLQISVQNDNKIVAGSNLSNAFTLTRLAANGTLDNTFGNGGKVTTPFSCATSVFARTMKVGNESILIFGTLTIKFINYFVLASYDMSGRLNTAFARQNGKEVIAMPSNMPQLRSTALDPQGRIIAAVAPMEWPVRNYILTRIIP